jgi:hypothetical protein
MNRRPIKMFGVAREFERSRQLPASFRKDAQRGMQHKPNIDFAETLAASMAAHLFYAVYDSPEGNVIQTNAKQQFSLTAQRILCRHRSYTCISEGAVHEQ